MNHHVVAEIVLHNTKLMIFLLLIDEIMTCQNMRTRTGSFVTMTPETNKQYITCPFYTYYIRNHEWSIPIYIYYDQEFIPVLSTEQSMGY